VRPRHLGGLVVAVPAAIGLSTLLLRHAVTTAPLDGPAARYLSGSAADAGPINVVTTILLDYRAFDTLGEASVIFTAVAAIGALFAGSTLVDRGPGLSLIVRTSVGYLAPLFWLFPVYIVFHGHLSPGGGFQGGVSLAVLVILLYVVFGTRRASSSLGPARLHAVESMSALGFLLVGMVGVVQGVAYLSNAAAGFPTGTPGRLLSGGMIPLLNLLIGLKVAAGLGSIFLDLLSGAERP
jgi:multicomponent Na+:H+ antiporter subunit B